MDFPTPYLTAAEAAAYLRLEESTLNAMRWRKEGPCWRKHGGRVVYHKDSLDFWSESRDSDPGNRPKKNGGHKNGKNDEQD
ncbi:MAG: helix-turn-helix domain-containing protein [Pseudomonadota bacterium]